MGMFDSFYFEVGVLPNNKEPPTCEFQTKSLDCQLDNYTVNTTGRLYKSVLGVSDECLVSRTHPEPTEFTGEVDVYSIDVSARDLPAREQHYTLIFKDGWLTKATKTHESGFAERDAANLTSFSPDSAVLVEREACAKITESFTEWALSSLDPAHLLMVKTVSDTARKNSLGYSGEKQMTHADFYRFHESFVQRIDKLIALLNERLPMQEARDKTGFPPRQPEFKVGDHVYFHFPMNCLTERCQKATIVSLEEIYGYDGNNCTILYEEFSHRDGNTRIMKKQYLRFNTAALKREPYEPEVRRPV